LRRRHEQEGGEEGNRQREAAGSHTAIFVGQRCRGLEPSAKNGPENHGDHEDHAYEQRDGTDHAEVDDGRGRVLPPATGEPGQTVAARSASFLHRHRVPRLELG
jgi:hypothetical protein